MNSKATGFVGASNDDDDAIASSHDVDPFGKKIQNKKQKEMKNK